MAYKVLKYASVAGIQQVQQNSLIAAISTLNQQISAACTKMSIAYVNENQSLHENGVHQSITSRTIMAPNCKSG